MFFASGVEIALLVIALGASVVASIILKPKTKGAIQDQEPTTLASRGAYVPWIVGRRRTGAVIGWVGDRQSKNSGGGGKKGFFGGGGGDGAKIFSEAAWHQICVGPAAALHRIWQDGKLIFDQTITPSTHPSGSALATNNGEGMFEIYWGEESQPVNAYLGDMNRVAVNSRWPFCCYVVWTEKNLGFAPRWPVIDYEIEVHPYQTTLTGGQAVLADTAGPNGADDGVNPAHVLEHLITQPFPHGMGESAALLNYQSLDELAALMEAEQFGGSFAVRDGDTAEGLIAVVLQDVGLFLPLVDGLVRFHPIRTPTGDQPILTEDILLPPLHEIDSIQGSRPIDSMVFVFKDRALAHRDQPINIDEDGQARYTDSKRGRQLAISSTVNFPTAVKIADRRALEEVAGAVKYKLFANHATRRIFPGQSIRAAGIAASLRVITVRTETLSSRVELECVADFYGVAGTNFSPNPAIPTGNILAPTPNIHVLGFNVPGNPPTSVPNSTTTPPTIVVPVVRPHAQTIGSEIWISDDGTSYHLLGSELGYHAGGKLLEDFAVSATEIDIGAIFEPLGPDLNVVEDLSAAELENDWRRGRQLLVMGDEIMLLRRVEALGPGAYRMRGLLRGQYGSAQENHTADTKLIIVPWSDITAFSDPLLYAGNTVHIKARPFTAGAAVDLSSVTPITVTIPSA